MIVAGIDENGYGPILGPLVVTLTVWEVKEKRKEIASPLARNDCNIRIRDSKKVFGKSKRGNEEGERTVLSLLSSIYEKIPKSSSQLLKVLGVERKDFFSFCSSSKTKRRICWEEEASFPLWIPKEEARDIWKSKIKNRKLKIQDLTPLKVKVAILCPFEFNLLYKRLKNKILLEYSLIEKLIRWFLKRYEKEEFVITVGKLSNQKYYQPLISTPFGLAMTTVREEREVSEYTFGKRGRIMFLKDGEEKSLPIAASSMFGKYVREIWMKGMNNFFEKEGFFVGISGYRDKRTKDFIKKVIPFCKKEGIPESCLLRSA